MKRKNKLASLAYITVAVILVAVLCYALYRALIIYIPQQRENERYGELRDAVAVTTASEDTDDTPGGTTELSDSAPDDADYSMISRWNSDLTGWLRIPNTDIDYPVMKSDEDDPEYYLHRDFDRNYSFSGSLFIGGGCDTESDVFVIYGHNMNNGSMFGTLDDYRDDLFLSGHSRIYFDTLDERRVYQVFSVIETRIYDEDEDAFRYYDAIGDFSSNEYRSVVQNLRDLSLISIPDSPEYPQQILLLSTCSYHTDSGRFVVAAYRID